MMVTIIFLILPEVVLILGLVVHHLLPRVRINPIDLMTPFLLIACDRAIKLQLNYTATSLIVILVMLVGIFAAIFLAIQRGEIIYRTFFKLWWRLVFILGFIGYLGCLLLFLR
ncbi:hypothetical protein BSQ39_08930 [Loigolactobacillus backii]|uniref:DUF3397 domain-containing protein n=1 Tax=Loigolactobacillus backii TaxID=375175 RepID=A0A192H452_9LACO|nr:DUF3397 family protein [Loigolactobacillus backii]ANK59749.1 hypothetical protein AYR52_05450 [Loigolactobacillus backii]ANK63150.1 hypothetical protein AYR53_10475 [Loigolactobacillus backii]ANK64744.1 hypothetical protein AYR54_05470 [Loigolactobacillus backii]ANK66807.1 hypothetical protein AYR55_03275 [Loigolactobacillus backii]ANK69842.1 hypothetical protein AYR56_06530 [Loigolactobacillus backii]